MDNDGNAAAPWPLVVSDLDPKYSTSHKQPVPPPPPATTLDIRPLPAETRTVTPVYPPIYPPAAARPPSSPPVPRAAAPPATPNRTAIPVPPLLGGGGSPPAPKTVSPVVAVGRRSRTAAGGTAGSLAASADAATAAAALPAALKIPGGRPKGWKPGMSYREVALRNMGLDGDDAAAAVLLLPPRPQQQQQQQKHRRRRRRNGNAQSPSAPRQRRTTGAAGQTRPNYRLGHRPGRPPRPPIEAVQRAIFAASQASFLPFACEWAGCRAELQNLATLRRHVLAVHGGWEAATTCRWRTCQEGGRTVTFTSSSRKEAFRQHMEQQHLLPVAWHQGDGMANNSHLGPACVKGLRALSAADGTAEAKGSSSSSSALVLADLPCYLLDDEGKQLTPLVPDVLPRPAVPLTQLDRLRLLRDILRQDSRLGRGTTAWA